MSFSLERHTVGAPDWIPLLQSVKQDGGRLGALWASDQPRAVHALLVVHAGLLQLDLPLTGVEYPDASTAFPAAVRMQRAIRDLHGLRSGQDERPWLVHGDAPYAFVQVEGDGVHEIPVGPVHAGIIEPGHFRFTANGETVVRLEERLGYVHKGVEAGAEGFGVELL